MMCLRPAVAASAVAVLVGAALTAQPAASATADTTWTGLYTVATTALVDSAHRVWQPADGLSGGVRQTISNDVGATGSPQLYRTYVHGLTSWTVDVPTAGTFAVDLMVAPPAGSTTTGPFSLDVVRAGARTRLATNVSPTTSARLTYPTHVTASFTTSVTNVRFELLPADRTVVDVSGLQLTRYPDSTLGGTTLVENFDGPAGSRPAGMWASSTEPGWDGSTGVSAYTNSPANGSLTGDGKLAMTAVRQNSTANGRRYTWTSSRFVTRGTYAFGFGHIETTAKAPAPMSGVAASMWAKGINEPTVGWPACGEIDIMENLGRLPGQVSGNLHMSGNQSDPVGSGRQHVATRGRNFAPGIDTTTGFHTYGIDYRPNSVTFLLDGKPYHVATRTDLYEGQAWPFDGAKFSLILSLQVTNSGWTGSIPEVPAGTKVTMLTDSVIVSPGAVANSFVNSS